MAKAYATLLLVTFVGIAVSGCTTVMPDERQAKLDGLVLYGLVNRDPSPSETRLHISSALAKQSCVIYRDDFCTSPEEYDFVTALISNTYWGGIRNVGVFIPKSVRVRKFDVVVVRFRRGGAGEFLKVASRGESDQCGWRGGGPSRALFAAGIVCNGYDWAKYRSALYD
jgi:hypothetical protein